MRAQYFDVPTAPKEYVLDLSRLDGGLNLWEVDYRIADNQSPDMENMYWVDGALGARRGQEWMYETALDPILATYETLFNDYGVFHAGTKLYKLNLETGVTAEIYSGLTAQGGTFFDFKDNLYYLNGAQYVVISSTFVVTVVEGYKPIIAINREPDGTGGDLYEFENRIAAGKWVHFTADGTSTEYVLPVQGLDATAVQAIVNDVTLVEGTGFTVNRTTGIVTFSVAPTQSETAPVVNNVKILYFKANTDARDSILKCKVAVVYGDGNDIGVVVGGPPAQPNGYFWSGSHSVVDPTYFPLEYYNFAGATNEQITDFGRQQTLLIIFNERSIGKTSYSLTTIGGREVLQMPYLNINSNIGCDLPKTVQLVLNNLVFCNTKGGVYLVADTSDANENSIVRLSRNINGTDLRKGLLYDVRKVSKDQVSSVDDNRRYRVVANGHSYVWDYTLNSSVGNEEKLSWFYFTNTHAVAWIKNLEELYYGTADGKFARLTELRNDFGDPIYKKFRFATQFFDTYELLKDVSQVIFTVRSDTNTIINITYETDYESRQDPTPIRVFSYRLSPRDLAFRILRVIKFATANVRKPGCRHVRHFSMTLTNNEFNSDMSLISAQIFYKYSGGDR